MMYQLNSYDHFTMFEGLKSTKYTMTDHVQWSLVEVDLYGEGEKLC